MPSSSHSSSQRSTPIRTRDVPREEPSPKRARIDKPSNNPVSPKIKYYFKEVEEDTLTSFVAKSFYGLKKNRPAADVRTTSGSEKSFDNSQSVTRIITGNSKTLSRLDKLMLEKVVMSPVKQAVLQTCSLAEFRKMYRDEYKELEEEITQENCRMTRRTSRILKQQEEDDYMSDDSSDDEVSFRLHDQVLNCKTGDHVSSEVVKDMTCSDHSKESLNGNYITRVKSGNRLQVKEKTDVVVERITQPEHVKQNTPLDNDIFDDEESDELSTLCKENTQVNNSSNDSSKKLSPSFSERRFFKTRSPKDNYKIGGVVLGKGFNLKFTPKNSKTNGDRKKKTQRKRLTESVSSKASAITMVPNCTLLGKSASKENSLEEPMSPVPGFTFAPGFLSPEKDRSDISEGENDSLDLNKSNCCTYGSASPKQKNTLTENRSDSPDEFNSSSLAEDTGIPARKDASDYHLSGKDDIPNVKKGLQSTSSHKLFSIFERRSARFAEPNKKQSSVATPASSSKKLPKDINNSQMIIDAGQKKFGVNHCPVCGMVYCHADPMDEAAHAKFHKRFLEVLKFPGWKKERVVQEYPEDLGRVILVLPDDAKYARNKVEEVNQVMGRDLGFPDTASLPVHPYHKVFLYVEDKQITGCCVAEPVQEGYRIIPGDLDNSQESGQRPWCCASVPEPVSVGISRLWVAAEKRKCGVATKLVDCVRQWFNYGSLIPKHKVAFSDPTPDGRRFAQKYMGTPTFLVYKFNFG